MGLSRKNVRVEANWHEGICLGIRNASGMAVVGTPHRIVFARSIRRVPTEDSGDVVVFNGIKGVPWDLQPGVEGEREIVNRVQLDVRAAVPEAQAPPPTAGEHLPRRVYIRRSVELARYGYTDKCIHCQHARLGLKPVDHSEECRARIVRHMTADDDLSQRVQIAQQRVVETAPSGAQAGERDSVPEPARKKVRFAERVEEQTPEGTFTTIPQVTSSSSSSSSSSSFSSSSTTLATSMQVDESDHDHSKRQKLVHGTDMELEGLVMEAEFDRLQRYSDRIFFWCKPSKTRIPTLTKLFSKIARREGLVTDGCPSTSPRATRFCPPIWSHPWVGVGFTDRMGLERSNVQNCGTFTTRKANFDSRKLEWTWCQDRHT